MLEQLQRVDWTALTHAYGSASDVPGLLRNLAVDDPQARQEAYWELYSSIFHQGTRYPAAAPAVPFLIELLADPSTPDRHELLVLLAHLVSGHITVVGQPVTYAGEADDELGEPRDAAILRDIYQAAEHGLPLYRELLVHGETAMLRSGAACMLASLWTHAVASVAALTTQIGREASVAARATMAFALGRLQGETVAAPILMQLHEHDPSPVVRLLAAVGLVRGVAGEAADAALTTIIAAITHPDVFAGYEDLLCSERDVASDMGYVLRDLAPERSCMALPALSAALARAEDFGTMGLVEAMLACTFGEPPEPRDDLPFIPIDPASLSGPQRQVLTCLAENHELWTIGNLFFLLRCYGIPSQRNELAALLGLAVGSDDVAEAATQARFHATHLGDPDTAIQLLEQAVARAPSDAGVWQQLSQVLAAGGRHAEALTAIETALVHDPDSGDAQFERGLLAVHTDPLAAAGAFARAAELGYQPLQSLTNQSTCLAMVGHRETALQILEQVTGDHPTFVAGWYSLGLARIKLGRLPEAIVALDHAIAGEPDHANAHYARACAYALQGAAAAALADIGRALAIDPSLRAAIREDADFESLAGMAAFAVMTAEIILTSSSDLRN